MCISIFPNMNPGSQQLSVESLRLRYLDERPIFPVERSGMARGLDLRSGGMLKSFHDIWAFGPTLSDYSALHLACMCSLFRVPLASLQERKSSAAWAEGGLQVGLGQP